MIRKWGAPAAVILILAILCQGCWDNRDITELNIVSAVGIDRAIGGGYDVSAQIIKNSVIDAREQGSTEEVVWTLTKSGKTVFETLRNMLSAVGKRPLYSHTEMLVIGEDAARDGIKGILDFFERDHKTRRRAYVLIARGITAKQVIDAKSDSESIPIIHVKTALETVEGLPQKRKLEIIELVQEIGSAGREVVVGVIQPADGVGDPDHIRDLEVTGGAVFAGDKLIGWIEALDMRGYLFAVNEVKSGIMNIDNPLSPGDLVSIEIKRAKCEMDAEFKDGQPVLIFDIRVEGNIGEQHGPGNLTSAETIGLMEMEYQQAVLSEVANIVSRAQNDFHLDIFGFGELIHRKNLKYWNSVKDRWNSVFSGLPVCISVKSVIKKPGLVRYPMEEK